MKWGSPPTYAWLHRVSLTEQYKTMLLLWLQTENPELHKLVLKEIGIEANNTAAAKRKGKAEPAMALGSSEADEGLEPDEGISEMGNDLLAGGA